MRNKEVPDHGLEGFAVWRHVARIDRWHDDASVGNLGRVATILPDNADDARPDLLGQLHRGDQIGRNVLLEITPSDGENEKAVLAVQLADAQPLDENARPAIVVGPGRQLRHVVGWSIGLDAGDLAEIVDRMRGIGGTAADPEEEKPAPVLTNGPQFGDAFFAVGRIYLGDDLGGFL